MPDNKLCHFDILVNNTEDAEGFYQQVFPNWTFQQPVDSTPKTIDPGALPNGAFIERGIHLVIPFFRVTSIAAAKSAIQAQSRMDNQVEIKEEGLSHPILRMPYLVFTDPDGCWLGIVQDPLAGEGT